MVKNAIVTGASRGIGKEIAIRLSKENYNVFIFGRDEKSLKNVQKSIKKNKVNSEIFIGGVADEEFVHTSIKSILKKHKKMDLLINNAGVAVFKLFTEITLEDFKIQIDANLLGVFNFSKAVIDSMIKRKSGTIINIVSQAGKVGFKYGTTYAATKHAVMGFSKSLLLEVREHNIKVVTLCPGSVETEMIANSPIHKNTKQVLKPGDIAQSVISIVKMPERATIDNLDIRPTNP